MMTLSEEKKKTEKKRKKKKTGVKKKDKLDEFDLKETFDKCQEGNYIKLDPNIKGDWKERKGQS